MSCGHFTLNQHILEQFTDHKVREGLVKVRVCGEEGLVNMEGGGGGGGKGLVI